MSRRAVKVTYIMLIKEWKTVLKPINASRTAAKLIKSCRQFLRIPFYGVHFIK